MRPWQTCASSLNVIPLRGDDGSARYGSGEFDAYLPWTAHTTGDSGTACIDVCISYVVTIWTNSRREHCDKLQVQEGGWKAGARVASGTYQRAKGHCARSPQAISTICWRRKESHQAWCFDRAVRGASNENGGRGRRFRSIRWRLCDNRRWYLCGWLIRGHVHCRRYGVRRPRLDRADR
jgi:hypothetical protein